MFSWYFEKAGEDCLSCQGSRDILVRVILVADMSIMEEAPDGTERCVADRAVRQMIVPERRKSTSSATGHHPQSQVQRHTRLESLCGEYCLT
jgi:hypothetical protein